MQSFLLAQQLLPATPPPHTPPLVWQPRAGRQSPPAGATDSGWAASCLHWLRVYAEEDMRPVVTGSHAVPGAL